MKHKGFWVIDLRSQSVSAGSPRVLAWFILVRVACYPGEASLDDAVLESFRPHAASDGAELAFAPVGLWPTGDRDEAGNEGFCVKFEGIERF